MKYLKSFSKINEAISDYQEGDSLVTNLNYNSWEDLIGTDSASEVERLDVKFISSIVGKFADRLRRGISDPVICKRVYLDKFDSCISYDFFDLGAGKSGEYVIFYKFIDEWWLVELHYEDICWFPSSFSSTKIPVKYMSYKYFLCDGKPGLQKLMIEKSMYQMGFS